MTRYGFTLRGFRLTAGATAAIALLVGLALGTALGTATAQQGPPAAPAAPVPYFVGNRLGMPINPAADGMFNADVQQREGLRLGLFGRELLVRSGSQGHRRAESRRRPERADQRRVDHLPQPDGSVHTSRWVGVQNPGAQRDNMTPPLVLNEPLGSDIANGVLYLADRDGGTGPNDPVGLGHSQLQHEDRSAGPFDPRREIERLQRHRSRGRRDDLRDADRRRRSMRTPASGSCGRSRPTARPRSSSRARRSGSRTASPSTRRATSSSSTSARRTSSRSRRMAKWCGRRRRRNPAMTGSSSCRTARSTSAASSTAASRACGPNRPAELIAQNIPNPASMCYDSDANQLVIPMNANNALSFIRLR